MLVKKTPQRGTCEFKLQKLKSPMPTSNNLQIEENGEDKLAILKCSQDIMLHAKENSPVMESAEPKLERG